MFKLKSESQEKHNYFAENTSIPLELTEEEYKFVFEAAGDVGSMGKIFRQMLEHGLIETPETPRSTSFWVPALFYAKVKRAAKEHDMSTKTYVHLVIRKCIADMRRRSKDAKRSSKALERGT